MCVLVQEKEALVRAMAKELGDLEQAKDGQLREANRKVRASTIVFACRSGRSLVARVVWSCCLANVWWWWWWRRSFLSRVLHSPVPCKKTLRPLALTQDAQTRCFTLHELINRVESYETKSMTCQQTRKISSLSNSRKIIPQGETPEGLASAKPTGRPRTRKPNGGRESGASRHGGGGEGPPQGTAGGSDRRSQFCPGKGVGGLTAPFMQTRLITRERCAICSASKSRRLDPMFCHALRFHYFPQEREHYANIHGQGQYSIGPGSKNPMCILVRRLRRDRTD